MGMLQELNEPINGNHLEEHLARNHFSERSALISITITGGETICNHLALLT